MGKGIAVPKISMLHKELQAIGALRAGAPSHGSAARVALDDSGGLPNDVLLLFPRQIPRHLVMITMSGNLVPLCNDRLDRLWIPLGDPATGQKCSLDSLFPQDPEDPPDRRVRSILCLGVFLVVDLSIG